MSPDHEDRDAVDRAITNQWRWHLRNLLDVHAHGAISDDEYVIEVARIPVRRLALALAGWDHNDEGYDAIRIALLAIDVAGEATAVIESP